MHNSKCNFKVGVPVGSKELINSTIHPYDSGRSNVLSCVPVVSFMPMSFCKTILYICDGGSRFTACE
jgi:hypothetical protein